MEAEEENRLKAKLSWKIILQYETEMENSRPEQWEMEK